MKFIYLAIAILSVLNFSCIKENTTPSKELDKKMNNIAESYVKLILNIGLYDPDYVDAYYGPEEWKPAPAGGPGDSVIFSGLYAKADTLLDDLEALSSFQADGLQILRFRYLYKQLLSAKARIFMLAEGHFSFDEETKALYDASAPHYDTVFFKARIDELDKVLPGNGDVQKRLENFKNDFVIPVNKLDDVFQAAIAECRKRTLNHIKLPPDESFKVEYVSGKPWAAYNWYKGNSFSVIQVNTGLPIYIDRAVDLAAHEGYPGHHVYNVLLEHNMVKKNKWMEFSVYPLFSPQSLIAEGTANFGINMAFPGDSRIAFERDVLFPIAGLDTSKTDDYYKVLEITDKLEYAFHEVARSYLDGKLTREQAIEWMMKYGLRTRERADQNIRFIEKYRSYVINYNLGEDIVKNYVEKKAGTDDNEMRWRIFEKIISTPQTPSGLQEE